MIGRSLTKDAKKSPTSIAILIIFPHYESNSIMNENNFTQIRKNLFIILSIFIIGCNPKSKEKEALLTLQENSYPNQKLPLFFQQLIKNHQANFHRLDSADYSEFVKRHGLDQENQENRKTFYTLKILHLLFTSKNATNKSRGEIISIPYFWHWVTPNPRYEIIYKETNEKLSQVKTPKNFSKYKSYADIDRIPSLFLADLVSETPKYNHPLLGDFKTFGWCSEREMAFICLLKTLNIEGKVVTKGNHSWSECIVRFKKDQIYESFKVRIDNTFDQMKWEKATITSIKQVLTKKNDGMGGWYNTTALSKREFTKVNQLIVTPKASKYIENQMVTYLKNKNGQQ